MAEPTSPHHRKRPFKAKATVSECTSTIQIIYRGVSDPHRSNKSRHSSLSMSSVRFQHSERVGKRAGPGCYTKGKCILRTECPYGNNLPDNWADHRHGGGIPSLLDYMRIVLYMRYGSLRWTMTSKPSQKTKNTTRSDRESARTTTYLARSYLLGLAGVSPSLPQP